jgi:hypothetical protein
MDEKKINDPVPDGSPKPKIDDVLKKMEQTDSDQDKRSENTEPLEKLKNVLSQADSSFSQSLTQQTQDKKPNEQKPVQTTLSPNVDKLKEKIKKYQK